MPDRKISELPDHGSAQGGDRVAANRLVDGSPETGQAVLPGDAEIGDKAFSNPPSDLTAGEKTAVRQAIDVTPSGARVTELGQATNRSISNSSVSHISISWDADTGDAPQNYDALYWHIETGLQEFAFLMPYAPELTGSNNHLLLAGDSFWIARAAASHTSGRQVGIGIQLNSDRDALSGVTVKLYGFRYGGSTNSGGADGVADGVTFSLNGTTLNIAISRTVGADLTAHFDLASINTDTQSDWDETDQASKAFIANKPTIPSQMSDLSGEVPIGQIPDGIARDAEMTAAIATAVAGLLNQAQVDNRVDALVEAAALVANASTRWAKGKLPADITYTANLTAAIANFRTETQIRTIINGLIDTALAGNARWNNDAWAAGTEYDLGTFTRNDGATYVSIRNVPANTANSEPGSGTDWQTYWYRVGFEDGPPNAFVGATVAGDVLTLTRESGQNAQEVTLPERETGTLGHTVIGSANFTLDADDTYTAEAAGQTPISRGDIVDTDLLGVAIGGSEGMTRMAIFPATAVPTGRAAGSVPAEDRIIGRCIYVYHPSTGGGGTEYVINLAWDADDHLLLSCDASALDPAPLTLYRFAKQIEDDDPELPTSRAESIGITADIAVAGSAWVDLTPWAATPEVLHGEGDPIIITREGASTLAIPKGVYQVWAQGTTGGVAGRQKMTVRIRDDSDDSELMRATEDYERNQNADADTRHTATVTGLLYLNEETTVNVQVASGPDEPSSQGAGAFTLYASGFRLIFVPQGGAEPVFYPVSLGEATFGLTGQAQQVALVDGDGNPIIAPSTGLLIFTINIPSLDLYDWSEIKKADRLRRQRSNTDLPSGLYTDESTHQIYYEVAAHEGGATAGNTILVEHVKTTVPTAPAEPMVHPSITQFDITSGPTRIEPGDVGQWRYGYELAIAQAGHVASARIVGYVGARGSSRPTSVAVLKTIDAANYHHDIGIVAPPTGTNLVAGDIYTLELQVFEAGQAPATDEPVSYHDDRIDVVAAQLNTYFGAVISTEDASDITLAAVSGTELVFATRTSAIGQWTMSGIPAGADHWLPYFAVPVDADDQIGGFYVAGISVSTSFAAPVQRTIGGVDYSIYLAVQDARVDSLGNGAGFETRDS